MVIKEREFLEIRLMVGMTEQGSLMVVEIVEIKNLILGLYVNNLEPESQNCMRKRTRTRLRPDWAGPCSYVIQADISDQPQSNTKRYCPSQPQSRHASIDGIASRKRHQTITNHSFVRKLLGGRVMIVLVQS